MPQKQLSADDRLHLHWSRQCTSILAMSTILRGFEKVILLLNLTNFFYVGQGRQGRRNEFLEPNFFRAWGPFRTVDMGLRTPKGTAPGCRSTLFIVVLVCISHGSVSVFQVGIGFSVYRRFSSRSGICCRRLSVFKIS